MSIGSIDSDLVRKSGANTLTGSRDGNQIFGSLNYGKTFSKKELSLSKNISPMSTAVQYDRVLIIKLLLESSTHGNPYLDQIESIFEESIKYINTMTLKYLLVNHYCKLKEIIHRKFNTLILRFSNIEEKMRKAIHLIPYTEQ